MPKGKGNEMTIAMAVKRTEQSFIEMFLKARGAEVMTAEMTTDPKLKRTGNPWAKGQILKRTKINGMLGVRYANAVNNQLAREGKAEDFVAAKRQWGQSVKGFPFVVHTSKDGAKKAYLEVMVLRVLGLEVGIDPETGEEIKMDAKPVYFDNETGKEVAYEAVKPFLPAKSKSSRQGTEKEIIWRTPELGSLDNVKLRKLKVLPKGWGFGE